MHTGFLWWVDPICRNWWVYMESNQDGAFRTQRGYSPHRVHTGLHTQSRGQSTLFALDATITPPGPLMGAGAGFEPTPSFFKKDSSLGCCAYSSPFNRCRPTPADPRWSHLPVFTSAGFASASTGLSFFFRPGPDSRPCLKLVFGTGLEPALSRLKVW